MNVITNICFFARLNKKEIKLTSEDRDNNLQLPPIPMMIAATNVDFPVPFGPRITFKFSPGKNETES